MGLYLIFDPKTSSSGRGPTKIIEKVANEVRLSCTYIGRYHLTDGVPDSEVGLKICGVVDIVQLIGLASGQ